jgi:hypothetical protein
MRNKLKKNFFYRDFKMPRFETEGDPICIAYGVDEQISCGVFLSVYDRRLEWQENASKEVNHIAESIGVGDGGGSYFDLHTGQRGFGAKVSCDTMRVYLKRYGVESKRIEELFKWKYGKMIDSTCSVCYKEDTKKCGKCGKFFYCGKECQIKDWPQHKLICNSINKPIEDLVSTKKAQAKCVVCFKLTNLSCSKCGLNFCGKSCQDQEWSKHKHFCDSLPVSIKNSNNESVWAFLFPENSEKVIQIQVPIIIEYFEEELLSLPQLNEFIGSCGASSYMPRNPYNKDRLISDMLLIHYRDTFLIDGSKSNLCIKVLTQGRNPHDWRGPVVVMKAKGTNIYESNDYIDIKVEDFLNIVDYFLWYGSNSE